MTQRWENSADYAPTETGYSLASGDKVWAAVTWASVDDPVGQTHLWLCKSKLSEPWITSYDRIDGWTPVWGSLGEVLMFLEDEKNLPGGRQRWMAITIGDYWRWGEGKKPRRATSRKTIAAIKAAREKEDK